MDIGSLNKRAEQVSSIFNILANVVAVFGALAIVIIFVTMITGNIAVGPGIATLIGAAIYTVLVWAGIQMSSVVAGYISVRTSGQTDTP